MNYEQPGDDQFEVSVFGPGRGECILVHLGFGDWMCVDSLIDRQTRKPVALSYLDRLGVDAAEALRLLVVTHWHQDHMKGAAEVLRVAREALFACSGALRSRDFFYAVGASEGVRHAQQPLHEFSAILGLIESRRGAGVRRESASPHWLQEGTVAPLTRSRPGAPEVRITAVSPSNGARRLGLHELATSIPVLKQPKRRAVALGPNEQCVALWIDVGEIKVLLGADLEDVPDAGIGWKAVLASPTLPDGRARMFKVPHHGSSGADNADVWQLKLEPSPIAVVTPFAPLLPSRPDQERLAGRTRSAYCTSNPQGSGATSGDRVVQRKLRTIPRRIRRVIGETGHVRLRVPLSGEGDSSIDLSNGAATLPLEA